MKTIRNWFCLFITNIYLLVSAVYATPPILNGKDSASSSSSGGTYGGFTMENGNINLNPANGVEVTNGEDAINNSFTALKTILGALRGIGIIVCVICLVYGAVQIAMAAGNPQASQKAKERIKLSLVGTALIGGATVIVNIFYNIV